MDLLGALQNGGTSLVLSFFACPVVLLIYLYISRSTFLQANFGRLIGLALELFLLAIVSFVAAVCVLLVFHSRFEQEHQFSGSGAVTVGKLTNPLDFALPVSEWKSWSSAVKSRAWQLLHLQNDFKHISEATQAGFQQFTGHEIISFWQDRAKLQQIFRFVYDRRYHCLWANTHFCHTSWSCEDKAAGGSKALHIEYPRMEDNLRERGTSRSFYGLVAYIHWILIPRHGQIWLLRGL